ncbi:secreted trypsin-like serine protease [Crossiella equi]|uniref:Secreted trypsin-like serine protease n=1 Tax=Crossiella equi TaxID=130796 RepID=A0ABS5AL34_9PSEU|nr:serine protease [Crossiella equi]MBP2477126.1 secreted trypsin-like serine protease [Crossiella equi]
MATTLHRLVKFIGVAAAVATLGLAPATVASAAPAPEPTVDPLVVGGTSATTQQYPWTVALLLDGRQWCGGTLVKPNKVVTAAHCTEGKALTSWQVVAGRTDLRTSQGTTAKVTKVWQHPNYRSVTSGDDVAVMTLDKNLPYTTLPIAGPSDGALYAAGTQARALGWGDTTGNGDYSDTLNQVVVPLTSDQTCATAYGSRYKSSAMVCAGFPQGGKDTCQADSGGPLVVSGKLIGVTSWGDGCALAGKPGVYARVSSYYSQLNTQINS